MFAHRPCPHCEPYPGVAGHLLERTGIVLESVAAPLVDLVRFLERLLPRDSGVLTSALIRFGVWAGVLVPIVAEDHDSTLPNRTMVVVREARARGITVHVLKVFGRRATAHFVIETPMGRRYFESVPLSGGGNILYDDKWVFKKFLGSAGLPVPRGGVFHDFRSAARFVDSVIGFPAVVKPRAGSLTKHTSVNIKTPEQLCEAVRVARMISREFLVEEHIPGEVYRVTLVGGKVAAACLREAPNVVGDGVTTMRTLIAAKNADPRRGDFANRNVTLHKIVPHPSLDLNQVPGEGTKVLLHHKALMGAGGDVHDATDLMHPDNRALCERLARSVDAHLLGIDLITRDISVSHKDERLAILEANTVPYIDMHHYPVTGTPRNVAGMLLDAYVTSLR